jgi:carboxylesterase
LPIIEGLDPSAFFLEGGTSGILLLHGLTGAPTEMRLIGDYMNKRGLTVSAPLLPGHGTFADDLNNYGWDDWYNHAREAYRDLREKCTNVFVAGLSMGSLLTMSLAATENDVQAIITYAPAIDIKDPRRFLPGIFARFVHQLPKSESYWVDPEAREKLNWSYETWPCSAAIRLIKQIPKIKKQLPAISCPLLVVYSHMDRQVGVEGARILFENVSSIDRDVFEVKDSGHGITLDKGWRDVADVSYRFLLRHGLQAESDSEQSTTAGT